MKNKLAIIYACLFVTLQIKAQISCNSNANCPAVANASVGCIANNCQILSCDPGFADCNGIYSDGCEVNLNALGITISANANTAITCSNTSITFNATPVNAGSSPSFQWKKNGVNVGTGTSAYTNNTWSNGDYVECVMIISTTCPPPATVWSNRIYVNLDNPTANNWQQKADLGFTQANGPTPRTGAVGFSIGNKGYIGTGYDPMNGYRKDLWEYDPATNSWTQRADFGGVGRERAVGFNIGNKGYIGTGYDGGAMKNDFWEYDPISNTWVQKANFGGVARDCAVGFSIGNKGYIGTGQVSVNYADFWEYDPASNIWTQKANFSATARFGAVGFSIGNKGYIGTGMNYSGTKFNDFWEYDPGLNTWTQKANFGVTPRVVAVGFSLNNKGYIGLGIDGGYSSDFWEYNPASNTWTQKANFGGAGREYAVGFSIGNKAYVGTGQTNSSLDYCQNDFWEYNPTTDSWLQKSNFGGGSVRYGAVGFNIGNKGYIGTGAKTDYDYLKDFWEYNPTLNTWTQIADFGGTPRRGAVGFCIGDKGYLGTGDDSMFPPGASDFWEYNPSTNTWTQLADVGGFTRYDAVGFSIGNKGYIGTGIGYNPSTGQFFPNDFWEFDPALNTWTQKADFSGGTRYQAVGFSIGNSGYIGTGQDNSGVFKNDFWEYSPATDIWTQRSNLGGTARCGAVGFSIGSKGYIGTGYDNTSNKKDFWQYDATTNTWIQKVDFGGFERGVACGFSIGNKGYLGMGGARNDLWEYSPTNTRINTGPVNTILCPGTSTVAYTVGCIAFNPGNVFTAQLSDSLGSFANPSTIGTVNSTNSGNINVTIPANFQSGNKYRIRLIGSNPETIGTDNGQDITFSAPPTAAITGSTTGCGSVTLTATGGSFYAWSGGNITNTATNTFNSSNTYAVTVTDANSCTATALASVTVTNPPTWYLDADNDNYYTGGGLSQCTSPGANYKNAGLLGGNDCNDTDNSKWQSNTLYVDADNDGYDAGTALVCYGANTPTGYKVTTSGADCNDADASKNVTYSFYADTDGDTYGTGTLVGGVCAVNSTTPPSGYSNNNTDCDDTDNSKWQSATLYIDADNDGYDAGIATVCYGASIPGGYKATTSGADCNDADASKNVTYSFYADTDGDTYGTGTLVSGVCAVNSTTPPSGYSANNTDCDDNDNAKWQSASLFIDADNDGYDAGIATVCYGASIPGGYKATTSGADCNDADASKNVTYSFYADTDGDTYGTGTLVSGVCAVNSTTPPSGYSANNTDCDDSNSNVWQLLLGYTDADADNFTVGAIQNVCSGSTLPQGYSSSSLGEDTDDNNPNVTTGINNPGTANEMVKIYPNPASSNFTIELQNGHSYHSLLLQDVTGKAIQQLVLQSSVTKKQIDISALSEGMYLLILRGSTCQRILRLIKQ